MGGAERETGGVGHGMGRSVGTGWLVNPESVVKCRTGDQEILFKLEMRNGTAVGGTAG